MLKRQNLGFSHHMVDFIDVLTHFHQSISLLPHQPPLDIVVKPFHLLLFLLSLMLLFPFLLMGELLCSVVLIIDAILLLLELSLDGHDLLGCFGIEVGFLILDNHLFDLGTSCLGLIGENLCLAEFLAAKAGSDLVVGAFVILES